LSRKEHRLATICMGRLKIHQTSHGLGLQRHSAIVGRIAVPGKVKGEDRS